tara:strand:- start:593 stop:1075 length:483 start_codon:yes stop_codon:yes gene_type:complete
MVTALYPGTFDPVTLGHFDVVARASKLFEKVVIGVYSNSQKNVTFSSKERVEMWERTTKKIKNISVKEFNGLAIELAKKINASVLVRGLRSGSDFEFEFEMAFMNKQLNPEIETICLMTNLSYQFISSSLLKEVLNLGGNIHSLVPSEVIEILKNKFPEK